MEANRTEQEHQPKKGRLLRYPTKSNDGLMCFGIQEVDEKLVENGGKIEAEIRTRFCEDLVLDVCVFVDPYWEPKLHQNGGLGP